MFKLLDHDHDWMCQGDVLLGLLQSSSLRATRAKRAQAGQSRWRLAQESRRECAGCRWLLTFALRGVLGHNYKPRNILVG